MTKIIGISAFYHDSAVALVEDGKILYASQEERFSRKKHDSSFPHLALKNLFSYNKINLKNIDYVVFYEKPFLKFERLIETYLAFAPSGIRQFLKSMPIWLNEKLYMKRLIVNNLRKISPDFDEKKLFFSEHHLSHAGSAFFPSPFEKSLIFTADGVGEWTTTSVSLGQNNSIKILKEIHFPNSLGLLYSAFTYYCGFKVNSGEYKLMGLAPFGKPKYAKIIKDNLIDIKTDGSFRLNQNYFDYATGFKMTNEKFSKLFGKKRRKPEAKISNFYMDIASSIQKVTEEILIKILYSIKEDYKIDNLCLSGGVALNCVANGKIKKEKIFKNIWIQPASGDSGGALGAALAFWYIHLKKKRITKKTDEMHGSYLGPKYNKKEISNQLDKIGAKYQILSKEKIIKKTAQEISKGKAIGWFQGRMEFGPRALGSRSIIADPRNKKMQKNLNLKIKFRESFRPFAPSIIFEKVNNWFEYKGESPYMLMVANLNQSIILKKKKNKSVIGLNSINEIRSKIPAITHVDNSARIQTVHKETNPVFYKLITEFHKISKVPLVVNTSFNIRGEPIVCSPTDAFKCLMGTGLDFLVIEDYFIDKNKQNKDLIKDYRVDFELD